MERDTQAATREYEMMRRSREDAVVKSVKKNSRSASPSKKLEQEGKNLVDGIEMGVRSGADDVSAAGQSLGQAAADGIYRVSPTRVTTNKNTAMAAQRDRNRGTDATGLGLLGKVKSGQASDVQTRKLIQTTNNTSSSMGNLGGSIMQASFAFSSMTMLFGSMGIEVGNLNEIVFGLSNAAFALSLMLPLVTTLFKKLNAALTAQTMAQLIGGVPGKIGANIAAAKVASNVPKVITGGLKNSWTNLGSVAARLSGVLGKVVPLFLRFVPFLGLAIAAFGIFKTIGDIAEKQKQKIEGLGNAAFATGKKLEGIASIVGFEPTRTVDRSGQITAIEGL